LFLNLWSLYILENEGISICCAIETTNDNENIPIDLVDIKSELFEGVIKQEQNDLPENCGLGFTTRTGRVDNGVNKTQKITGGKDARPGEYPWMVKKTLFH